MNITYYCTNCYIKPNPESMDSMVCKCGGDIRPEGALFGQAAIFEPYYDRVLGSYVSSYSEQERKARAHRSPSHPEGLMIINDDKKFINECKNISRHKEDYKAATQPGYKPGQKFYNTDRPDQYGRKKRQYFIGLALLFTFLCTPLYALEADYVTFNIQGKEYQVPIPNKATRDDFYLIKKAIAGDELARELVLGGKVEKKFFIGDNDAVRWLILTKYSEEVIEYPIGA